MEQHLKDQQTKTKARPIDPFGIGHQFSMVDNSDSEPSVPTDLNSFLEENSEFQKLGTLNSYLGKEDISQDDKILLIYHQILEELHEGCNRSQVLTDQKE